VSQGFAIGVHGLTTRTTLNVSLPVEVGRFVEERVAFGRYSSASEIVRTALRLLEERDANPNRYIAKIGT
jgi:antitoxin ParD1/3/4